MAEGKGAAGRGSDRGMGGPLPEVEVARGAGPTVGIMMGEPGAEKPKAKVRVRDGYTTEVGGLNEGDPGDETPSPPDKEDADDAAGDAERGSEGGEKEGSEGDDGEKEGDADGEGSDTPEDLGAYDPSDDDAVGRFDAAYIEKDGALNTERLSAEWWANAGADPDKGALNEGTYDYLRDRFGLPKEVVKEVEAGQRARAQTVERGLYDRAGGKDKLDAAIKWGRTGGYTKEQRERFNTVMASGDTEAINDAVDALTARHARSAGGRGLRPRRPLRAERDVTTEGAKATDQGFESREEYRQAVREAKDRQGNVDQGKMAAINRKLRASRWWKAQQG